MDRFLKGVWRVKHASHNCSFLPAAARDKLEIWTFGTARFGSDSPELGGLLCGPSRSSRPDKTSRNPRRDTNLHDPDREPHNRSDRDPARFVQRGAGRLFCHSSTAPVWARETKEPAARCGDSVIRVKKTFPTKKTVDYWFEVNGRLNIVYNTQ